MSDNTKLLIVVLIYAVWGLFAFYDVTLVAGFIQALRDGLVALGVFQATITLPPGGKP